MTSFAVTTGIHSKGIVHKKLLELGLNNWYNQKEKKELTEIEMTGVQVPLGGLL